MKRIESAVAHTSADSPDSLCAEPEKVTPKMVTVEIQSRHSANGIPKWLKTRRLRNMSFFITPSSGSRLTSAPSHAPAQ